MVDIDHHEQGLLSSQSIQVLDRSIVKHIMNLEDKSLDTFGEITTEHRGWERIPSIDIKGESCGIYYVRIDVLSRIFMVLGLIDNKGIVRCRVYLDVR